MLLFNDPIRKLLLKACIKDISLPFLHNLFVPSMNNDDAEEPHLPDNSGDGTGDNGSERRDDVDTNILLKTRPKTKKPSMYKVLLLNDDFTPMEFVVHVIETFFNKTHQEATEVMLHVHRRGVGLCGVFTYEIAETKVAQVMDFARANEHPLQCTMEKE